MPISLPPNFNALALGERYESEILDGEPPADAEMVDWAAIDKSANTPIAGGRWPIS
ncbi:MAG: hypothetical protein LBG27_05885 [Spirochaetaceae bacterium]|nr:hypothetical protein [Spirochaetaceae bacterium]